MTNVVEQLREQCVRVKYPEVHICVARLRILGHAHQFLIPLNDIGFLLLRNCRSASNRTRQSVYGRH